MSTPNALPSERVAVGGVIDPEAQGAATVTSDWLDMTNFQTGLAIVLVGEMAATSTVDAKIEQATDGSGTGAKDLSGSSITQLTAAGSDDDKQVLVQFRSQDLDITNDFTHARLSVTVGTAASDLAGVVLGMDARTAPASDNDLASVDEIVTA